MNDQASADKPTDMSKRSTPWKASVVAYLAINAFWLVSIFLLDIENLAILIVSQMVGMIAGGAILGYWTGYVPLVSILLLFMINFSKAITDLFNQGAGAQVIARLIVLSIYLGVFYGAAHFGSKAKQRRLSPVTY